MSRAEEGTRDDTVEYRIGYFTADYPQVSQTFIRREILGLEALGYSIERFAIKPGDSIVESVDLDERLRTTYLLAQPVSGIFSSVVKGLLLAGRSTLPAVWQLLNLARASDRGLLKHMGYLSEALMLRSYCRERDVDHLHVHFGTNAATVAFLTKLLGGPTFSVTVHGPVEFDQPYGQSLGRKLTAACFVSAISSYCMSQLYRWLPMEYWKNIHIVPCSVGDEWFDEAMPIDANNANVVTVARLDEQKGQLLLIEAFADAVDDGFRGKLVVVGDGPLRTAIEERVSELGIEDKVAFEGWLPASEIRAHLLSARALVLPSFAEGLPVVIMEAMAMMRPVLASRITGIPELVRHDVEGWLVTPANSEELRSALVKLEKTSLEELLRIGSAAQARVRERHHTDVAISRLDMLIRAALTKRRV